MVERAGIVVPSHIGRREVRRWGKCVQTKHTAKGGIVVGVGRSQLDGCDQRWWFHRNVEVCGGIVEGSGSVWGVGGKGKEKNECKCLVINRFNATTSGLKKCICPRVLFKC